MRPYRILMIEDSPADVLMTREALEESPLAIDLHVVEDGERAMQFLRRTGRYSDTPRPDLILLDLNLPRKDGREVLAEIKVDESLKTIPVIVLTTSQAPEDVRKAYRLHSNCYIRKPVDFESYEPVVRAIERFWFTVVTLPPE
jgi:chemotaxis family two-component system response regulator Rcp1